MKKRVAAGFIAAAVALASCRTLVGIDDLTFQQAPPDGGNGQGGRDEVQQRIATCHGFEVGLCRACCRADFGELAEAYTSADGGACVCSTCAQACASATQDGGCDPTASPADGGGACAACVDGVLSQTNNACTSDCTSDECKTGLTCLQGCGQ